MKFTVLGSGLTVTPPGLDYRYPSSHLVEIGDKKILLDAGIGVLPQLVRLNLQPTDIDAICISHFHADHFNLSPILQALHVILFSSGGKRPLRIFGPPSIENRVRQEYQAKDWTYDSDLLQKLDITYWEYQDQKSVDIFKGINLTPFKTQHFQMDAYALRLEAEGKALAYSGDSTITNSLTEAAGEADLFVCEAAIDIGADINDGHLSPQQTGEVALKAGSKKLCLVHYSGNDSSQSMLENVRTSGYRGEVIIADDLSKFAI